MAAIKMIFDCLAAEDFKKDTTGGNAKSETINPPNKYYINIPKYDGLSNAECQKLWSTVVKVLTEVTESSNFEIVNTFDKTAYQSGIPKTNKTAYIVGTELLLASKADKFVHIRISDRRYGDYYNVNRVNKTLFSNLIYYAYADCCEGSREEAIVELDGNLFGLREMFEAKD